MITVNKHANNLWLVATEDSLFDICRWEEEEWEERERVNLSGVHRRQESRDTGNWTLGLGGGTDI